MSTNPTSDYIKGQKELAAQKNPVADRLKEVVDFCWRCPSSELPPIEMMNVIGSHSEAHFRSSMAGIFQELVVRGKVNTDFTVLDIGAGCGRFAIPFVRFLDKGKYYGVDVWEDGVDWCKMHFAQRSGSANFLIRKAQNNYYFSDNTGEPNNFDLKEIPRSSINFAFAISVFTHLVRDDCYSYLSELSRVLSPGSCAYLTCFIIDDFFFSYVEETGKHISVSQEEPGCYYAYKGQDFFAGYTTETWRRMIENSGLRIVSQETGNWANKPGAKNYQDTFVVIPQAFG